MYPASCDLQALGHSAQGKSKESSAKRYPAGTVVEVHERIRPLVASFRV